MLLVPFLLTAASAAVLGWAVRGRRPSKADGVIASMAVPALFLFTFRSADAVVSMLSDFWCFIRLMPAVALRHGYRLYYPDGEGPLLGWSYGPVMPVLQLPIGFLPDPVSAVLAGGVLNQVVLFLPLFLLLCRALPPTPSRPAAAIVLLVGLQSLLLTTAPSSFWVRGIQVDSFALGLSATGFWILLGADPDAAVSPRRMGAAAAMFAAAVFTKQNELFVLTVPVVLLAIRDGRSAALRMILFLAAAGGLGFLLCLAVFGWEALFLNMWLVPARHPWVEPGFSIVGLIGLEFLQHAAAFLILFAGLAWLWQRSGPPPASARDWVRNRPWVFLAAAALVMFPISVMGKVKAGGADNSNHSLYYLVAAVGMMGAGLTAVGSPRLRRGIPAVALALSILVNLGIGADGRSFDERRRDSLLEREYRFALRHPGEAWYSANPLATLYSDGRLYHHGYGVCDRTLAQLPPTPRHLRDHLPERLRWVSTPGFTFWQPDGLRRIPHPDGISQLDWFEVERR